MSTPTCPEYEYKVEEYYVVAVLPTGTLKRAYDSESGESQPKYAMIDIESDQPMLELEGHIYRGTSDELLGTSLVFDAGASEAGSEQASAELIAKTSRVITFYPVNVSQK
ncbi:hypothetical protein FBU31_008119 [Coemansia sp. 'formosensis']|nr:hypothetical protein FBU31_008119 [Coemansia sp. 'formosensis']